jgi:hypothetical protein
VARLRKLPCAVAALSLALAGCAAGAAVKAAGSRPRSPSLLRPSAAPPSVPQPVDASPSPVDAPPALPTRTVTREPWLASALDLESPLLPYFTSTAALRREHLAAQRRVDAVRAKLRANEWSVEVRTGCLVEHDGYVVVEGRAAVLDREKRVRAFSETSGTEHSAATWKLYYDESSRPRVVTFTWRSVAGQEADGVMLFDEAGHLKSCNSLPNDAGVIFCGEPKASTLDSEVEIATRDQRAAVRSPDALREASAWVNALDPLSELSECETPYRRAEP